MQHDAHGHWIREAARVCGAPLAPLHGDADADVVVVGGGYLGLWTAWHLLERAPGARVVVLEAQRSGFGPSGRNGGFVNGWWDKAGTVAAKAGDAAAVALGRAAQASVETIGAWCESQHVDAWYHAAPHLLISAAPAQDGVWVDGVQGARRLGEGDEYAELSAAEVAARCRSPLFRGGALLRTAATVQPARLAFGLRDRLAARGTTIHENTRVQRLTDGSGGVVAEAAGGRIRARAAVVAVNHATAGLRPFRRALSVASSHMVITEPVPDVIEAAGWTGGEAISDCRTMLHYFRTTPDGRIAFGWGGGRMGFGARRHRSADVDAHVVRRTARDLVAFFPALRERRITRAWGGPIDVSPVRLPIFRSLGRVHAGFGFTGNGVGPSELGGRILSALALDERDELTRLVVVEPPPKLFPPEPLRYAGGSLIRAAMIERDERWQRDEPVPAIVEAIASLPRRLGMSLPR
jgi:glycine/D-amino acid oxidase-like deaminating enzyme